MSTVLDVGLHYGVPASVYHADPTPTPSLSSGVARTLLSKSPAHAALEHPRMGNVKRETTAAMSTGTLVHAMLSGSDEIVVGEFKDFKTKAAQEWREAAEACGKIAVLGAAFDEAEKAANAVRLRAGLGITRQPFTADSRNEVTAIWKDGDAYCRARFDTLDVEEMGDCIAWDWKSTSDITDRGISQSIAKYRYDIQAAFYLRGLDHVLPKYRGRTHFVFVFFETKPPFAVRRVKLSASYLSAAALKVNEAIRMWDHCLKIQQWPLTSPDTFEVELPAYLETDDQITASE